jgi:hypothetical protein
LTDKKSVFGILLRDPTESELSFFRNRPDVGGYAAPDDTVVLNPYTNLSAQQRSTVALNEAARVHMRTRPDLLPRFGLTDEQRGSLLGTDYDRAGEDDRRATIAARLLSNDPSGGSATAEQKRFLHVLRGAMGLNRGLLD